MKVKRNEMDTAPDTSLLKSTYELIASDAQTIQLQLNHVKMPRMLDVRRGLRANNFGHITKSLMIEGGISFPRLPEAVTLFQLGKPQGRGNIGQIVFEPWKENFVVPGSFCRIAVPRIAAQAMQTHHPGPSGILRVVGGQHAAFTGGNVFRCIEGKTRALANASDRFPVISSWKRVRGIFYDPQIVGLCN